MIVCTTKMQINYENKLKKLLKDEKFPRGKNVPKKLVILVEIEDSYMDHVEGTFLNLLNQFGQDFGLSFQLPSITFKDDYTIIRFSKNVYIFEDITDLDKLIQACRKVDEDYMRSENKKLLFRTSMIQKPVNFELGRFYGEIIKRWLDEYDK